MADDTLAFRLDLRILSTPTADVVERLVRAIHKLVEDEQAEGFHAYSLYINWPLINQLKTGHGGQANKSHRRS